MCRRPTVSVVIPFYMRHAQLRATLDALGSQTLEPAAFEVVLSSFGEDDQVDAITSRCKVDVRVVRHQAAEWNVAKARNVGMAAATGEILLLLDCDIALHKEALSRHVEGHRANPRSILVGAVRGYLPYANHSYEEEFFAAPDGAADAIVRRATTVGNTDVRWTLDLDAAPLAWALCWSGHLSVERTVAAEAGGFNEAFRNWGAEDLEFAFRLVRRGSLVRFDAGAWGVHLSHPRSLHANIESEQGNLRRFVNEHPCLEVEVLSWLNDLDANRSYCGLRQACVAAAPQGQNDWGVALSHDRQTLCIGLRAGDWMERRSAAFRAPLLGLALPFESGSVGRAHLAPWLQALPARARARIEEEAVRVTVEGYEYGGGNAD